VKTTLGNGSEQAAEDNEHKWKVKRQTGELHTPGKGLSRSRKYSQENAGRPEERRVKREVGRQASRSVGRGKMMALEWLGGLGRCREDEMADVQRVVWGRSAERETD